jgi:hypothetical protein
VHLQHAHQTSKPSLAAHFTAYLTAACALNMQRQQAKENELRQEVVQLQGRERTASSEVESKHQDIDSIQGQLGRLKGDTGCPHPAEWLSSISTLLSKLNRQHARSAPFVDARTRV